jgi:hypothetical protein
MGVSKYTSDMPLRTIPINQFPKKEQMFQTSMGQRAGFAFPQLLEAHEIEFGAGLFSLRNCEGVDLPILGSGIQKSFGNWKPLITGLTKTVKTARFSKKNSHKIKQAKTVNHSIFLIYRSVFRFTDRFSSKTVCSSKPLGFFQFIVRFLRFIASFARFIDFWKSSNFYLTKIDRPQKLSWTGFVENREYRGVFNPWLGSLGIRFLLAKIYGMQFRNYWKIIFAAQ